MNETPQQYIARILATLGGRDPFTVMSETPARLRAIVSHASPDQLTWKSEPTRWSIAQILAHLADAEVVGAWRFRSVLARDGGPLAAYDQDEWASAFKYEQAPVAESLALFEAARVATLSLLQRVDAPRRNHVGIHSERGPESITRLMEMFAGHDLNHLGQIERLLEESKRLTAARTGA
jgi:uncharacterized damage-inducible protein DinB